MQTSALRQPTTETVAPSELKLGARERRFLVLLWDRVQAGEPFPTTEQIDAISGRDFGTRGGPAMYRQLSDKGLVQRSGRGWPTGSFTARGLAVAAAVVSQRHLIPPRARRAGHKSWAPEMGARTVHRKMRRSPVGQDVLLAGIGVGKLGGTVTRGWLKGATVHYLTLEERATCPTSCPLFSGCYGDVMARTLRFEAGPALVTAIDNQLSRWHRARAPRNRLIRLHELGDFFSADYVSMWSTWLARFPWLHVFGFTAHTPDSEIGAALLRVRNEFGRRFAIRFSNSTGPWSASVVSPGKSLPDGAFWCPEQSGRVANCASCGLCWSATKAVAFKEH